MGAIWSDGHIPNVKSQQLAGYDIIIIWRS
jgi:hypothetical protein